MRRSLRDAFVGFSLIGGVIIFSSSMLWLRGFRLGSQSWEFQADFEDATGLAVMSPVTFRGIIIGSVQDISFTAQSVRAKIKINKKDIILNKPVIAKIVTSSVLGGDAQLSLVPSGNNHSGTSISPTSNECKKTKILCKGDLIKGQKMIGISSLTESFEEIVDEADRQEIVSKVSQSISQFDQTQLNLDELILLSKEELVKISPIIDEIGKAAAHLNNILSSIDNPKTLNEIKEITSTTNSLATKMDTMSSDLDVLINDKELINAMRKLTIGLGKFFQEIYP